MKSLKGFSKKTELWNKNVDFCEIAESAVAAPLHGAFSGAFKTSHIMRQLQFVHFAEL